MTNTWIVAAVVGVVSGQLLCFSFFFSFSRLNLGSDFTHIIGYFIFNQAIQTELQNRGRLAGQSPQQPQTPPSKSNE